MKCGLVKRREPNALYIINLVFIDVMTDATEHMTDATEHVYPMQIRGGAMNEMWLSKTERT